MVKSKKRKILNCKFCGYMWCSNRNPKKCPRCHNPTNGKPQNNLKKW